MPGVGSRMLARTLAHLSGMMEQAEQAHRSALGITGFRAVDARVKVISAVLLTVALVGSSRLEVSGFLLILFSAIALSAQITWKRLLAAWAGGLFFAGLVAVPAIFTSGLKTPLLLVIRSEASLTCWLLVAMTTPFNRILRALRSLRVPAVFIAILSMTFRYIFLLVETAQDMLLSRRSRLLGRLTGSENRRILVSTTGVLLGKSIQMSEDVYHAMTSRGFRGEIQILEDFQMTTGDWLIMAATGTAALLLTVFAR